jgi:hypothetical protein
MQPDSCIHPGINALHAKTSQRAGVAGPLPWHLRKSAFHPIHPHSHLKNDWEISCIPALISLPAKGIAQILAACSFIKCASNLIHHPHIF